MHQRLPSILLLVIFLLTSCGSQVTPHTSATATEPPASSPPMDDPAFETGVYPNLFRDYLGKSDLEIQSAIDAAWDQLFYGDDRNERVYYPVGDDMAYVLDTGNDDVRSEGMSYGMMIAVQLNKKAEFDRLWKWAKTYMYQTSGGYTGYFAWHCKPDGTQLDANPASDGEEWFIMALFFADARWGSGEGIFNYRREAQAILDVSLHADEFGGELATNLFDPETKQVVFVPQLGQNSKFTDASYHLPHYYELWARWAARDNDFWAEAVTASRGFLKTAVHPETGLAPDYSYFDGTPYNEPYHGNFRYDAFRVGANIGVDHAWFGPDPWHTEQSNRMLSFFASQGMDSYRSEYTLEGKPESQGRSPGLIATNAVAALAADRSIGEPFVQAFWDQDLPTGKYRYYDGLLVMLGLLQVSGNFRIYTPGTDISGQALPTPVPQITSILLPAQGRALIAAGGDADSVNAYFDATVSAPGGVAMDLPLSLRGLDGASNLAFRFPNSSLLISLDLGATPQPSSVELDAYLDALAAFRRPVYLTISTGTADPAAARSTWQLMRDRLATGSRQGIALVWQAGACGESDLAAAYPGDALVDWIRVDHGSCSDALLAFARAHLKPILLHAAVPDGADLAAWYPALFAHVSANNDVIRILLYDNRGAGALGGDPSILAAWKTEIKRSFWLRASPGLFSDLGYSK